jgi:drug/metabolite transporter (DMT)-like permease
MSCLYVRGLLIGLLASVMLAAGLAMMKSRAEVLPAAQGTAFLRAIIRWVCDPAWAGGLIVETAGYVLYFAALAEAPVSLVAVMMQGGIAVFVIIAIVFLHECANRAEAAGIVGIILAMVLLALSLQGAPPQRLLNSFALGILSAVTLLGTAMLCSASRLRRNGAALAIASGVAFGLSSLYTKALADIFATHSGYAVAVRMAASPWHYLMICSNLAGLVLLQNSFHWARGIIAMPLSSAISNLVPIVGGIMAFDESLPRDPTSAVLRIGAFTLTIVASVLLAGAEITHNNDQPSPSASPVQQKP